MAYKAQDPARIELSGALRVSRAQNHEAEKNFAYRSRLGFARPPNMERLISECHAGKSRSVITVAAYLMHTQG